LNIIILLKIDDVYHSDGKVIIENGVGNLIAGLGVLVLLMRDHLDLPPIHHDGRRPADFAQDFVDGLAFVAAAPPEASSQIVARPQWNDSDGRMIDKLNFVCNCRHAHNVETETRRSKRESVLHQSRIVN
jgi:hypothetical protein